MAEYINKAALMNLIEREGRKWGDEYDCLQIFGDIEDFPPADVRPVLRGRWERMEGDRRFMCSVCKGKEHVPTIMGQPTVWDYCPNCGADMRGDADG